MFLGWKQYNGNYFARYVNKSSLKTQITSVPSHELITEYTPLRQAISHLDQLRSNPLGDRSVGQIVQPGWDFWMNVEEVG